MEKINKESAPINQMLGVPLQRLVMPCPRLEFNWVKTGHDWRKRECIYYLVLPLGEYDVRREDKEGNKVRDENYVELGRTSINGGRSTPPIFEDGKVETPFRDGVHAKWDSAVLGNLPVFSVCGDVVSQIGN